jgi:hypothetical protein
MSLVTLLLFLFLKAQYPDFWLLMSPQIYSHLDFSAPARPCTKTFVLRQLSFWLSFTFVTFPIYDASPLPLDAFWEGLARNCVSDRNFQLSYPAHRTFYVFEWGRTKFGIEISIDSLERLFNCSRPRLRAAFANSSITRLLREWIEINDDQKPPFYRLITRARSKKSYCSSFFPSAHRRLALFRHADFPNYFPELTRTQSKSEQLG